MSSELIESPELLVNPPADAAAAAEPVTPAASGCPVPHAVAALAPAGVCPFPHDGAASGSTDKNGVQRSKADLIVRKVLRIKERPANVSGNAAIKAFEKSMLISATRCILTYVVFPIVLPALSIAKGPDAWVGIIVGSLAMVCDVFTIRRFFAIDYKWRWHFTAVAGTVISLLAILLVQDIISVAT